MSLLWRSLLRASSGGVTLSATEGNRVLCIDDDDADEIRVMRHLRE